MAGAFDYSTTANSNSTVGGVNIAEGCNPSGINNAIRAFMADVRKLINDQGGKIVSGGAADVQTLTTESTITAYAGGQMFAFIAGYTNTGAATLNVDSVGAKAIRKGADVALAAGDIAAGALCIVAYDASADTAAGAWMLANPVIGSFQPLDSDLTAIAALTTTTFGRAFLALADEAAFKAAVNLEIGTDVQAYDADTAKLDVADQVITGGARVTSLSDGTKSSGTYTPDPGDRPMIHITNGGAFTLAPGSNTGAYLLDITNNGSAGTITTSGWTKVAGDSFTTTDTDAFRCHCSIGDAGSLLVVQALQ